MFHPIRTLLVLLLGGLLPACSGHYYGHYQPDRWYDSPSLIHHRVPVIIDHHSAPLIHQRTVVLHAPKTVVHQKRSKATARTDRPHRPHQPVQKIVIKPVPIKPKVVSKEHEDHRIDRNGHTAQKRHGPVSRKVPALEREPRHKPHDKDYHQSARQHSAPGKHALGERSYADPPGKGPAKTRPRHDKGQAGKGLERLGIIESNQARLAGKKGSVTLDAGRSQNRKRLADQSRKKHGQGHLERGSESAE